MATITDGNVRYLIMSASDPEDNCLRLNSTANKAACSCKPLNTNDNNQLWRVQASGAFEFLRSETNDYALEIAYGNAKDVDGTIPTAQKNFNQAYAMKWFLEPAYELDEGGEPTSTLRTVELNGVAYQAYFIHCLGNASSTRVLTAGSTARIYTKDVARDDQLWIFVPSSWYMSTYPVPSAGKVRTSRTGADTTAPIVGSSATLFPTWNCAALTTQARMRTRTRAVGADDQDISEWSDWICVDPSFGTNQNLGWGSDSTTRSLHTSRVGARVVPTVGAALSLGSAYDLIEAEFCVRCASLASAHGSRLAHSGDHSFKARLVADISITSATITLEPEGIILDWETDWARGGCSTKVTCDELFGTATTTADVLEVPSSKLKKMPAAGETYKATFAITTADGATITKTATATVASEGGSGLTLTSTVTDSIATIVANQPGARAWLMLEDGARSRLVEFGGTTSGSTTTFEIPIPIGVEYKIWATYVNPSTDAWASVTQTFPAWEERPRAMHFTSRDLSRDLALKFHTDKGGPEHTISYQKTTSEVITAGGARPRYGHARTTKVAHKVKGVLATRYDWSEGRLDFEWLSQASHVYFRDPHGMWLQVSIDTTDVEETPGIVHPVSISFDEEDW